MMSKKIIQLADHEVVYRMSIMEEIKSDAVIESNYKNVHTYVWVGEG